MIVDNKKIENAFKRCTCVCVYSLIGFQVKTQTSFEMANNVNQTGFNRLFIYQVVSLTSKWIGNIGPSNHKFASDIIKNLF
jgi:hypothetical protein